jgi:hypothetical protein
MTWLFASLLLVDGVGVGEQKQVSKRNFYFDCTAQDGLLFRANPHLPLRV